MISEYRRPAMSIVVTLRLKDPVYRMFRGMAEKQNRSLSNFIETAALRFVEEQEFVDGFEMAEIKANKELNRSLRHGILDAKKKRGRFV
jgi:predicted transcriptional regulator